MPTRTRTLMIAAAVVIAAAGITAGWFIAGRNDPQPPAPVASGSTVSTFTMRGAFTLFVAGAKLAEGTPCKGTGMYDDMQEGTAVKVFNDAGGLLATGSLRRGVFVAPQGATACKFEFSVAGVPEGPLKYGVAIGGHGAKPVTSELARSWVFFSDGP
ncbi:hypothetical protein [Amycolatopsis speibonae]|uniref:Serine/threonine protein kinase n=1 Tax=Amycolatopsis speibonae TaxID=1450224 RepID=A0ABV7P4G6_9PSEU